MKKNAYAMFGLLITFLVIMVIFILMSKMYSESGSSPQKVYTQKQQVDVKLKDVQQSIDKARNLNNDMQRGF